MNALPAYDTGLSTSHTLAAIAAAANAHKPKIRLARGTCRYIKITYTLSPIKAYRKAIPRYVVIGTCTFSRLCCASDCSTRASSPRPSNRKFSHPSAEPTANPTAQRRSRSKRASDAAATPKATVSHAIRFSVRAPLAATSSATDASFSIVVAAISGQAPQHLAHAAEKSHAANDYH